MIPSSTALPSIHTSVVLIFSITLQPKVLSLHSQEVCQTNRSAMVSASIVYALVLVSFAYAFEALIACNANATTVWTPLIPSTMDDDAQSSFTSPMGRPGQPSEVATCFVFLASQDSSFISGQSLHPNGGVIVNG